MKQLTQITLTYPGTFVKGTFKDTDEEDLDICERIFHEWNHGSQSESPTFLASGQRSMSVGDFVTIRRAGEITIYQCDTFGWSEKTVEYKILFERKVKAHPRFSVSSWSAMNDVLSETKELDISTPTA
jgi:hypothetical protein|tara:strand:- start:253 stop:636 length:384 start_codon:yes stop_codon:yes gene_type:complete